MRCGFFKLSFKDIGNQTPQLCIQKAQKLSHLIPEYLAGHDPDSFDTLGGIAAGNSRNAYSIVVYRGNDSGHVGAMVIGNDGIIIGREILASMRSARQAVGRQVFMQQVHAAIDETFSFGGS